jgi:predicted SnoaL-like aldol condensation-catalyzing enzyme
VQQGVTEDFKLHDPAFPGWPGGHEGARRMLASIRKLIPDVKVKIFDMVEQGDRVTVRWRFSGSRDGQPRHLSAVAIYRFAGGRIAENWGVALRPDWPEAGK